MLTKLYRIGPSRQRIRKGWVVVGRGLAQWLNSLAEQPLGTFRLILPPAPSGTACPVWLDTGMTWLHSRAARDACFGQLRQATAELSARVEARGGLLLPSAVQPQPDVMWRDLFCQDGHALEVHDELEREIFYNQLRHVSDLIIAQSGRCQLTPTQAWAGGSGRLAQSEQVAAPWLASTDPDWLAHLLSILRRNRGVTSLELLDIAPLGDLDNEVTCVEVRFNDAQALLSTTRAHTLLYQALVMFSRRMAREGIRPEEVPHARIEQGRVQAVMRGSRSLLPRSGGATPAGQLFAELYEGLAAELRLLEADFSELASGLLGPALSILGVDAMISENDMFRQLMFSSADPKMDQLTRIAREQQVRGVCSLGEANAARHPRESRLVAMRWEGLLAPRSHNTRT